MKELIINGHDVTQGRIVKGLEAMLKGASDAELREQYHIRKWDSQFYVTQGLHTPGTYMIKKEFNCLIVWYTTAPTEFNGGDEVVQRMYHPMCILSENREYEHQDVARDFANGLIRLGLLQSKEYISLEEDEND